MKHIYLLTFLVTLTSSMVNNLYAQEETSILKKRFDSLENRVKGLEHILIQRITERRSQTRSNLEKGELSGIVVSDNKGVSLKIGGFIQADAIHDLRQTESGYGFLSSAIVIPNDKKSNTLYNIGASRLNLSGEVEVGKHVLKTLLEFDMFNETFTPALRQAWAEYGGFGVGMSWSNFMDVDAYPNTLDYNGPNAMIFGRQVQFRYTHNINKNTALAFSLEDPISYVTLDPGFRSLKQFPDFTTSIQYSWGNSHIRAAGAFHPLIYSDIDLKKNNRAGYGVSLSTLIQQNRSKDNFTFQTNYGAGISKYFNDLAGLPYDGIYDAGNKKLLLPEIIGLSSSYDHWWNDKLSSTIGYGYLKINNLGFQEPEAIKSTQYGVLNFIYYPNDYIKGGVEFITGTRKNKNDEQEKNSRLQLTVQLIF